MEKWREELYHALWRKGKHKYLLKVKNGAQTRYFYTRDEIKAYYDEGKDKIQDQISSTRNSLGKTRTNITSKWKRGRKTARSKVNTFKKNVVNTTDNLRFNSKNKLQKSISNIKTKTKKTADTSKKELKDVRKKVQDVLKSPFVKVKKKREEKIQKEIERKVKYIKKYLNESGKWVYVYHVKALKEATKKANDPSYLDQRARAQQYYKQRDPNKGELDFKHKDVVDSQEQDQKVINPHFYEELGYQYNCTHCTFAYEMRRRGYDVEATKVSDAKVRRGGENTERDIWSCYKGAKSHIASSPGYSSQAEATKDVESYLSSQGPGARGDICIVHANGGHSMAWEVQDNGQVLIRDCQSNTTYTVDEVMSYTLYDQPQAIRVLRTDNLEIDERKLKKADIVTNSSK